MNTKRVIQIAAQITVKTIIAFSPYLLALGICALVGDPILIMEGQ